ncbi:MAG: hypothetical protein P4L84_10415 [Isosphaeraceae bacterium]|nr:hypothetical protein [Isosphaeraceae bacterium]
MPVPAKPPAPTPLLDAIAAKAEKNVKVDLASLDVVETAPNAEPKVPVAAATPAVTNTPTTQEAPAPAVVEVPSTEAPPVAGPETRIVIDRTTPKEPETKREPPSPAETWADGLKQLLAVARDQAGKNDGAADEWAQRYALLDWLNEPGEKPGSVPWRSVVAPLIHSAGGSLADTSALASELHKAVECLEDLSPLEVTSVQLCRRVKGFGCYDLMETTGCRPGRAVIVYCEMAGVRYEQDGDGFHSRVASEVELRPTGGEKAVWTHELGVAEDSCRRRRRDYYVNYRLDLPGDLPPGNYDMLLTQTDLVTHRSASRTAHVTVAP